jgi:hypothetical protein
LKKWGSPREPRSQDDSEIFKWLGMINNLQKMKTKEREEKKKEREKACLKSHSWLGK